MDAKELTLLKQRKADLFTERSSWMPSWQDISKHLLPRNGRFIVSDHNNGANRHNDIYDNTATRALRVQSAGLMGGATSPARPWFRLATSDPDLMEFGAVKLWLAHVTAMMRAVFNKSNTYASLHSIYEELGAFGTGVNILMPDYDNVIHNFPQTIGQYAIATSYRGEVDTLVREFEMTLGQAIGQFGLKNLSPALKARAEDGRNRDAWVGVTHMLYPRDPDSRDQRKKDGRNMALASVYYETNGSEGKVLRESGFRRFPALCPRWHVAGGDVYGNGPGQEALGDIKALKHAQLRKSQGLDYIVRPPLQIPAELKEAGVNLLPGGVNYVTAVGNGVRPMFEVRPDLQAQVADINDIRMRIDETFYKNLFMMLDQFDAGKMTATEVAERHQEKLQMVGPVIERLHNELLSPLIDITFDRMLQAGVLPAPPQELNGTELNVEFVSVLAQAQRAVGTSSMDRILGVIGSMAQYDPRYLDKLKGDDFIDAYSDMLGVDPDLIEANDKVAIVRQQRAQQQAQAQQLEQVTQMAAAAKDVGQAIAPGSGLESAMQQFQGY
jgi:hypothetical protein